MELISLYKPVRRFSYPLLAILILVVMGYYFFRAQITALEVLLILSIAAFLTMLWLWQRPGASEVAHAEEVLNAIGNGRPTFLNVYSNY